MILDVPSNCFFLIAQKHIYLLNKLNITSFCSKQKLNYDGDHL